MNVVHVSTFLRFSKYPLALNGEIWFNTLIRPQGSANGERGLFRKVEAIAFYMRAKVYVERQKIYLQGLSTLSGLRIHEGFYNNLLILL